MYCPPLPSHLVVIFGACQTLPGLIMPYWGSLESLHTRSVKCDVLKIFEVTFQSNCRFTDQIEVNYRMKRLQNLCKQTIHTFVFGLTAFL